MQIAKRKPKQQPQPTEPDSFEGIPDDLLPPAAFETPGRVAEAITALPRRFQALTCILSGQDCSMVILTIEEGAVVAAKVDDLQPKVIAAAKGDEVWREMVAGGRIG